MRIQKGSEVRKGFFSFFLYFFKRWYGYAYEFSPIVRDTSALHCESTSMGLLADMMLSIISSSLTVFFFLIFSFLFFFVSVIYGFVSNFFFFLPWLLAGMATLFLGL